MDPYLENPAIWPNFHHRLISELESELNRLLRPRYSANVEDRVYLSDEKDPGHEFVVPDVHILHQRVGVPIKHQPIVGSLATIQPVEVTTVLEDEIHESYIEILDRQDRRVVTVIEVLSPTNKLANSYGRDSYLGKRREVLSSKTHLLEIDLLRSGIRIPIRESLPTFDYLVHLSRADQVSRLRGKVWPIPLSAVLPVIPLPLKSGDDDLALNLQSLLNSAYDNGGFDMKLDYTREAIPPLAADQAEWAKQIIVERKPA
jgi:hypothetical protein